MRTGHEPREPGRSSRLRPSGGYRTLHSFQVATLVYDATILFGARFLGKRSRTVDQMVQAARSGRQNIAEGSRASAASSQTELRLVTAARASLDELLLDYEDFLRRRKLPLWSKDAPEARRVRGVGRHYKADPSAEERNSPADPQPHPQRRVVEIDAFLRRRSRRHLSSPTACGPLAALWKYRQPCILACGMCAPRAPRQPFRRGCPRNGGGVGLRPAG